MYMALPPFLQGALMARTGTPSRLVGGSAGFSWRALFGDLLKSYSNMAATAPLPSTPTLSTGLGHHSSLGRCTPETGRSKGVVTSNFCNASTVMVTHGSRLPACWLDSGHALGTPTSVSRTSVMVYGEPRAEREPRARERGLGPSPNSVTP